MNVTAFRAGDLVESFGVNVHFRYPSYIARFGEIVQRLKELGVRYIREGLENDQAFLNRLWNVHRATGARFEFVTGAHYGVSEAHRLVLSNPGVVAAIEGINEADNFLAKQVPDWVGTTRAHQQELYRVFKASTVTRDIPIYSPTVVKRESAQLIKDLPADFGAFHCYFGSRHPENTGWGSSANGVPYGRVDYGAVNLAHVITPGKSAVMTETGYFAGTKGDRVTEEIAGKYFPRLLVQNFAAGVSRTVAYEMLDQSIDKTNAEMNFGLIRNDGTPKPAFNALRKLFDTLRDSGTFTPGALTFELTGNTANVRTVLFQKRCGAFYLAYWLALPCQDPVTLAPINVPSQPITVTVPSGALNLMVTDSLQIARIA